MAFKLGMVGRPTPPLARSAQRSVPLPMKSQSLVPTGGPVQPGPSLGPMATSAPKPFATAGKQASKRSFFTGGKHPVSGEPM